MFVRGRTCCGNLAPGGSLETFLGCVSSERGRIQFLQAASGDVSLRLRQACKEMYLYAPRALERNVAEGFHHLQP